MKNVSLPVLIIISILSTSSYSQSVSDQEIKSMLAIINSDSVKTGMQMLEDFGTRFALYENRFDITDSIYNRFRSYGIEDVQKDSFMCYTRFGSDTTTLQTNVIATITGSLFPDQVYIIGAHYDSYAAGSKANAPGADDNASGTSAIMEIARAVAESGIQPAATIKFIAFGIEELMYFGDSGAELYVARAVDEGEDIRLMVNLDMISNSIYVPKESKKLKINPYIGFIEYADMAIEITGEFSALEPVMGNYNIGTDSYPFYEAGIPAVFLQEYDFSPYYHTEYDQTARYDMNYCREAARAGAAVLFKAQNVLSSGRDLEVEPYTFSLQQNYPNPFNPSTVIKYTVEKTAHIRLTVYDILGKKIKELVNEIKSPGEYKANFSAEGLSGGVYLYELRDGSRTEMKKMVYLR